MLTADRIIRVLTALTVLALGAVAAVVSFRHALGVVRDNGEAGLTAYLSPLTVDGLVLVAALVMLDSARRGRTAPVLAKVSLGLGIGATVAVNALHGWEHGLLGAIVAGWPAVALVLTTELLMGLIRRQGGGEKGRCLVDTPDGLLVADGVSTAEVIDEKDSIRLTDGTSGGEQTDNLSVSTTRQGPVVDAAEGVEKGVPAAVDTLGELLPFHSLEPVRSDEGTVSLTGSVDRQGPAAAAPKAATASATDVPAVVFVAPAAVEDAAEEGPVEAEEGGEIGREFGRSAEASDAAQPLVTGLASAVKSARSAGLSYQRIADEFGVTKYQVTKILKVAAT